MALPEILAPAGSFEALIAAVRCGADAVYIGGKNYSARQNACNFDIDEIKKAADICHLHGAKLYLAVNTLLLDNELYEFAEYIKSAANSGIDACIIQDMGAAEIIRKTVPDMPLHASTQMTIHTSEGALWAKEHGFCRCVIARELSRKEIKPIINSIPEVEQFVHGALCMSISGQCYLSAIIGSRSANRGRCAQACRLPFSALGKPGVCSLSLRDLSLAEHINELINDGVASLKIEGRMKRPEYTAAAVTAFRQARDGYTPDMESLKAVFSRSGFTDGYYTGKRQKLFGVREKEDVTAASSVLPKLKELYRKEYHHIGLDIDARLYANEPFKLTGTDSDGNSVTVLGDIPVPALKKPMTPEQLHKQLSKLGDTIYFPKKIISHCDGISMLPASAVNALRRKMTEELDRLRIEKNTPVYKMFSYEYDASNEKRSVKGKPKLRFRVRTESQLYALNIKDTEECAVPFDIAEKLAPDEKFILQPPRFVPDEKAFTERLALLCKKGFTRLICENPAHIRIGKKLGLRLCGGSDLHILNSIAAKCCENEGLEDILLSPELTLIQAKKINSEIPKGIYAYGRLPVMLFRVCPIKNEAGCKNCTGCLSDRTKRSFPVICGNDYAEMLNAVPIWTADKIHDLSCCGFILIDFTSEKEPPEILAAANAYRYGESYKPDEFTRGLLYRGI